MIRTFIVVLLTIACAAAEAVPVCMAVNQADVSPILGPSAKRTKDPSGCQWDGGDGKRMNVMRVGVASMFERAREGTARKGTTKTETGLGGDAFSTIPSAEKGARASIYLLKSPGVLIVDIDGFGPGGAEAHLPQVRDLVRKLGPSVAKE